MFMKRVVFRSLVIAAVLSVPTSVLSDESRHDALDGVVIGAGTLWGTASFFLAKTDRRHLLEDDPSPGFGALGMLVGGLTAGLGVSLLAIGEHGSFYVVGGFCALTGTAAAVFGLANVISYGRRDPSERELKTSLQRVSFELDLRGRLGGAISITF